MSGFTAGVLTISDKGAKGEREDLSGQCLLKLLEKNGFNIVKYMIVPDDEVTITGTLKEWVDKYKLHLITTTGGTGLTERDITPQATLKVIDYAVPGMAEAMRAESMKITPNAMLSRAVAGVRADSLIINFPGSRKSVEENFAVILPALRHGISKLRGDSSDCVV